MAEMNSISPEWLLIYLGLLAICLELILGVSTGFDMVVIGVALLLGGVVALVMGAWQWGLVTAILLVIAYVLAGRKYLRHSLAVTTHATNVDRLIGKTAHVVRAISPRKAGQVNLEGEIWRATANKKIDAGVDVDISSVEGVTLKVVESGK